MTKEIDTFFVVDFDRCLGNIEGSFEILKEIVHELGVVDRQTFKSMREKIESTGETFNALEYIKSHHPYVNLDDIEKLYAERAKLEPNSLLEPGSIDFINFLKNTNRNFCIMSFGDKGWQTIKIRSSGIGNVPTVVVPKSQKSKYIRDWLDSSTNSFQIPGECFSDRMPRRAKEVVLIDDKTVAFSGLPEGARGYFVSGSSSKHTNNDTTKLPVSVKIISHVDEIIVYETDRSID
ncbi:MAG TPA: hypothetical protein VMR16_02545 [Candidatus Saccharimonadales bacterium]|nr:hypothetical protein [Candidatus Saccharimonadales bacterium]